MTKPIPDKAEVALEYPDKFYVGTFDRTSRFDAHLDATGLSLKPPARAASENAEHGTVTPRSDRPRRLHRQARQGTVTL
jgi:hypothetical protein